MDIRTERLIAAFNESGLTQTELCRKTGINKGAMSSYLSGRYFPKQQAIEKLASVLHVPVFYLMGLDDASSGSSALDPEEERLVEIFRHLNAEGRRRLCEYANDLIDNDKYKKSNLEAVAI